VYEGTTVVMGPYSMVDGKSSMPTVTGTFTIYKKYESKTMRGFEDDGVTPYVTKDVPWAMYFHGGYALHGAPWRSTFGYSDSHGCINLPVSTAKQIYNWAPIGTVVVVHR
jgi:lipoprotein-anchoring transpeptidase ErfK/SrfK